MNSFVKLDVEDTISDEEAMLIVNTAIQKFKGDTGQLRNAIGVFLIGRQFGWKPAYLMFDKDSVRKYEKILDIKFRDTMPEEGCYANKSAAWVAMRKVKSFWKAVKGEISGIRSPLVGESN